MHVNGMDMIVRNYKTAMRVLVAFKVEHLYLDYDLGEKKTGLDVMLEAMSLGVLPKHVQVITMNPVGRERMERVLGNDGYEQSKTAPCNWHKT